MLTRSILIVMILSKMESASLTVYGAKLWSACSSLPLFHQPARWRVVSQFDVAAALRRHLAR